MKYRLVRCSFVQLRELEKEEKEVLDTLIISRNSSFLKSALRNLRFEITRYSTIVSVYVAYCSVAKLAEKLSQKELRKEFNRN